MILVSNFKKLISKYQYNIFIIDIIESLSERMQQQNESLKNFFKSLAKSLDRDPLEFKPFLQILEKNWYTKVSDLRELTQADYEKMNIPFRVSSSIKKYLNSFPLVVEQENPERRSNFRDPKKPPIQPKKFQVQREMCDKTLLKFLDRCKPNYEPWVIALETLTKILKNIVQNPDQKKYKTLKKSNKKIQNDLLEHPECIQFLNYSGFKETQQTFTIQDKFDFTKMYFVYRYLENNLSAYKNAEEQRKKNQEPRIKYETLDLSQKFKSMNQEKDEDLGNEKILLERLTLKQIQIQSSPLKNRNIKIYHKSKQSKVAKIREQVNIEEQFQKSDCELMVKYLEEYTSASKNMTKLKNQHQAELRTFFNEKSYEKAMIRIKLPNQHNVQAHFRPMEPLQEVLNLMKDMFPKTELYLFTIPPKKVMGPAQLQQTLKDLDMVPMACFHLGIQGAENMKDSYKQFIIS